MDTVKNYGLATAALFLLTACGSGGGSSTPDSSDNGASPSATEQFAADTVAKDDEESPIRSVCGVIDNGDFKKPVPLDNLEPVTVQPIASDRAIITRLSGEFAGLPQMIKLHGITSDGITPFRNQHGIQLLQLGATPNAYFISAGEGCIHTFADGALAQLGQLISSDGFVMSEVLRYFGDASPALDICGGEELNACYNSIVPREPEISPYEIGVLRWKPASDSTGNLVVLVDPYDITIIVNGEVGVGIGPSNGYGSTAHFTQPGCGYGAANVEFFDSLGRRVLTKRGDSSVSVNGCSSLKLKY